MTDATVSFDTENENDFINLNNNFAQALSLWGEISKFGASIGSCNVTHTDQCSLFLEPSTATLDNL